MFSRRFVSTQKNGLHARKHADERMRVPSFAVLYPNEEPVNDGANTRAKLEL
jgi:hypothetical protein